MNPAAHRRRRETKCVLEQHEQIEFYNWAMARARAKLRAEKKKTHDLRTECSLVCPSRDGRRKESVRIAERIRLKCPKSMAVSLHA